MTLDSKALWQSLRGFSLDDPAHAVPFSVRLQREQGWSSAHTSRVLDEYRRFLFLAATSDDLMVPSDAVDQAWHLHMLDTPSYWNDLCGRVVGHALHHTPSRGGYAEDARHASAYDATLRRYGEAFGEAAPADIWPCARERFAGRYRRIDTRDAWVIRKRFVHGGVFAGAIALLAGCSKVAASAVGTALMVVGIFAFIIGALAWAAKQARVSDDKRASSSSCGGSGGGCGCDGGGGCGGGGCGGGCGG